jgi:hypothetical protein
LRGSAFSSTRVIQNNIPTNINCKALAYVYLSRFRVALNFSSLAGHARIRITKFFPPCCVKASYVTPFSGPLPLPPEIPKMKVVGRQLNWGVMKARLLFIIHAQLMTIPNMTQHNTLSTMLINQSLYLSPRYYLNSVDGALRARHSTLRTGNVSTLLTLPCAPSLGLPYIIWMTSRHVPICNPPP